MVELKQMLYSDKYAKIVDVTKFDEEMVLSFVKKHLGDEAMEELIKVWEAGIIPINDDAPFEEKYETAYKNWIFMGKSAYAMVRERMGEEGVQLMGDAEVEGLKDKNKGPGLMFLNVVRAVSPQAAFNMVSKRTAYELQWLTPYTVSEMTSERVTMDIPQCKILDTPDTDDLCYVVCQGSYPRWMAEQFKTNMNFNRQGNSCTCTLSAP